MDTTITMFALRYALGRQSTAPGYVADYIIDNFDDFSVRQMAQIAAEVREHLEEAPDNVDSRTWKRLLTHIEEVHHAQEEKAKYTNY